MLAARVVLAHLNRSLAGASRSGERDAVAHKAGLVKLDGLSQPCWVLHEIAALAFGFGGLVHVGVCGLRRIKPGEQVADYREEQRQILGH